jgi:hypothetical protein
MSAFLPSLVNAESSLLTNAAGPKARIGAVAIVGNSRGREGEALGYLAVTELGVVFETQDLFEFSHR